MTNTYIYANGQILAQHTGDHSAARYFYLHDRLGSVREIIDANAVVVNTYTYQPFGLNFLLERQEDIYNPFKFTGQWFDSELGMYYLRARGYYPYIRLFTSRDPFKGKFQQPMTLHAYLYCVNNPINRIDPDGKWAIAIGASASWNVGGMTSLISKTTKQFGLMAGVLARNAIIANAANYIAGTAGVASVFGYGKKDGWFVGSMYYAAGGVQEGDFVGGVSADYAWSPNAQKLNDLAGRFMEVGGSGAKFGGTVSKGIGNDTYLITVSLSLGVGTHETHGYIGNTWVEKW